MDLLLSVTLPRPVQPSFTEELPAAAPPPVLAEEDAPPLPPVSFVWMAAVFRDEETLSIVPPALAEEALTPLSVPLVPYSSARPAIEEEWAAQPVALAEEAGPVLFVQAIPVSLPRSFADEELAAPAAPAVLVEEYPPLAMPPAPVTRWLMLASSNAAQAPPAVQVASGGTLVLTLPVSGQFTRPLPPVDEEKGEAAPVALDETVIPVSLPWPVHCYPARPFVDEEWAAPVLVLVEETAPVLFVWPAPFVRPLPPATEERATTVPTLVEETGPVLFVQPMPFVQPRPFVDEERTAPLAPVLVEEYAPLAPVPQPQTRWMMLASASYAQAPPAIQIGSGGVLVLSIRTSGRFTQPRPPATEERAAPTVLVEDYAPLPFLPWQAPWTSRQVFRAEEVLVTIVGPPPCTIEGLTSFAVLQAGLTSYAVLQHGVTSILFARAETTAFAFTHADAAAFRTVIIDTFEC